MRRNSLWIHVAFINLKLVPLSPRHHTLANVRGPKFILKADMSFVSAGYHDFAPAQKRSPKAPWLVLRYGALKILKVCSIPYAVSLASRCWYKSAAFHASHSAPCSYTLKYPIHASCHMPHIIRPAPCSYTLKYADYASCLAHCAVFVHIKKQASYSLQSRLYTLKI